MDNKERERVEKTQAKLKERIDELDESAARLIIENKRIHEELVAPLYTIQNNEYKMQRYGEERVELLIQWVNNKDYLKAVEQEVEDEDRGIYQ